MEYLLRRGSDRFEIGRAGNARLAFDSATAAESFLRGFLRDEWNSRSLRALFREEFPGTSPTRFSDAEVARRLAPLLLRDRLHVLPPCMSKRN